MCPRASDLEVEELAFALEEPRSESPHLGRRQDVSGEAEDWTVIVPWICPAKVGTYVPKFVEIHKVCQPQLPDTRRPAPERGPRKEGNTRLRLKQKSTSASLSCQGSALPHNKGTRKRFRKGWGGRRDGSVVHPAKPDREKAPVNTVEIILGAHAKSPCPSPSAAAATRSLSPLPRRTRGFIPSSEGRGVVSQIHAA